MALLTTPTQPTLLLRLLALRPVGGMPAIGGTALIYLLALLSLAVWIGVDWLNNQPDPALHPYGAPGVGWYVLLQLAIAAALARRSVPQADFGSTLVLVLLATPIAIVANFLVDSYLSWPWALAAVIGAGSYFMAFAALGLKALTGKQQPYAVGSSLVLVLVFGWATSRLYIEPSLWYVDEDSGSEYESTFEQAEPLLFSQSARIDAAVDAIEPPDGELPAAFFVGFAGVAEQRVFAEEIDLAAQVFGERFGTTGRSLYLVNDRRNLEAHPFANPTALRYALSQIAGRMRLDRDILFLSLSSHGSSDGALSVSHGVFMLHDLTAADLASSLQESGIKWRVIIVSACYSGAFIEPLRDANTIILTAAAADRTSFGCSDDRDLTYFGEAFYRDALPGAASLRDAFNAARQDIAARERREDIEESAPQAYFGADVEKHIELLRAD